MLTAPATNRRRTEYLWARAVNDRRILPNYAMSERPNTGILRSLLEMNRDHPAVYHSLCLISLCAATTAATLSCLA